MGRPEPAQDDRFATHVARGEHQSQLDELIAEWAVQYTAAELDTMLTEAGVVCAPVYSVADIVADEFFTERGLLVTIQDEVHGEITVPGVIPKLSGIPGSICRPARWEVGADTESVLAELGYREPDDAPEDRGGVEGTA